MLIVLLLSSPSNTMEKLQLQISISPDLYTKNPESSVLGQKIVSKSIEMIDALGFEDFTFIVFGFEVCMSWDFGREA